MKFSVQDQMERGRESLLVIEIKVPTCVNVEPCSTSVKIFHKSYIFTSICRRENKLQDNMPFMSDDMAKFSPEKQLR
ncbi:hypothetical protein PanWU01x14_159110 [Parasponia andersonii]|uniref:Uncharacterized protein n=1 Tax=Parasponia andersonii TaxID=3476 RepID=A0A2P5CEE9_PARAD|nr:hypothetical protein PanWU01x14_159110 [Parasponia andersonii]